MQFIIDIIFWPFCYVWDGFSEALNKMKGTINKPKNHRPYEYYKSDFEKQLDEEEDK